MKDDKKIFKTGVQLSLVVMLLLCVFGGIFYKERLFADTAYYAYQIIDTGWFCIQHNRYGAFITQVIPVLFAHLHLSLQAILIGYVVNLNLFFLSVSFVLAKVFRAYRLAILMALYYTLMVSDSYFWPNDEIHQAVAWMFLLFGCAAYFKGNGIARIWHLLLLSVVAFFALSAHFIVLIPLFFLIGYFLLDKQESYLSKQQLWLLVCAIACGIAAKFLLLPPASGYEQQHLLGITHASFKEISSSFVTPVVRVFVKNCIVNYWFAVLLFVAGVSILFRDGKKTLAMWCIAGWVGYVVLMGLTYSNLDKDAGLFHMETEWQCISIIMTASFVFAILPKLSGRRIALILSLVFVTRAVYIVSAWPKFHWRITFHEEVLGTMRKKGITKLAIARSREMYNKYILDWAMPYETLYASAIDGDKPQLIFMFVDTSYKPLPAASKEPDKILLFDPVPVSIMNRRYFNPDTLHAYRTMTYDELNK